MDEQDSGWAESSLGLPCYHFEHYEAELADDLMEQRDEGSLWVIVTINHTLAKDGHVHRNHYFADGLKEAIAVAAYMEIGWQEIAEDIVEIRPASDEERAALAEQLEREV